MALGDGILLVTLGKLTSKNFFIYNMDYHKNEEETCSVLICSPLGTNTESSPGGEGGPSVFVFANLSMQQVPFRNKCFVSRCVCQGRQQQTSDNGLNTKYLLIALEAGHPRSRCEQVCFLLSPLLGLQMAAFCPHPHVRDLFFVYVLLRGTSVRYSWGPTRPASF